MISTRTCTTRSRRGFTLVELMVAAALAITIMWILAESFKMGIDFARSARSTGDMMTQLNNVGQIMTRDLQFNHFIGTPTVTNSNGKLASQRLDQLGSSGTTTNATGYIPPNGYFQLYSPPAASSTSDTEGFQINTATATTLQFTAYQPGGSAQNQYFATVGGTVYTSRAAEIALFLGSPSGAGVATGVTPPTPGLTSQPLYNLYRRQRLVGVTSDDAVNLAQAVAADQSAGWTLGSGEVISVTPMTPPTPATTTPTINTLAGFSSGTAARLAPYVAGTTYQAPSFAPLSSTYGRAGDDILLTNVLSFEVLASWSTNTSSLGVSAIPVAYNSSPRSFSSNSNYPYDYLSLSSMNTKVLPNLFDTWSQVSGWNNLSNLGTNFSGNLIPMPIRVTSLQITVRIYDPKTKQARQNSWRIAM